MKDKKERTKFQQLMDFIYAIMAGMFLTLGILFNSYGKIEMYGICFIMVLLLLHYWRHD